MHAADNEPYFLKSIKDYLPEKAKFCVYILFGIIFQLSGGIYLALTEQMVGSLVLLHEDVLLVGYASMVGMTLVFPLLFRLKFRFTNKRIYQIVASGLIVCNLITMSTGSMPILLLVSFIAGGLKMWGFFECMSTIQLKITPTRDFAKFFPVVFTLVLGCIQLSGLTSGYVAYFYRWEYMHLLAICLLMLVLIIDFSIFRHFRIAPKQPLNDIDWLGGILWAIFLMLTIYALEYGEHHDWLYSEHINLAIGFAILALGINLWRARRLKHPYIGLHVIKQRHVLTILGINLASSILLATPNVLQNAYTGSILHYDFLTTLDLNWAVFGGIACGALFSYYVLVKLEWSYKRMIFTGFALILANLVMFYFLISPETNIEKLYVPLFLRGAAQVILTITTTLYAARTIHFMMLFQALSIFGFISTGFGGPLGTAILGRAYSVFMKGNMMSLGSEIDMQNSFLPTIQFDNIMAELQRQAMLVTIKEIYGFAVIAGIIILLLALCTRYKVLKLKMPRW